MPACRESGFSLVAVAVCGAEYSSLAFTSALKPAGMDASVNGAGGCKHCRYLGIRDMHFVTHPAYGPTLKGSGGLHKAILWWLLL